MKLSSEFLKNIPENSKMKIIKITDALDRTIKSNSSFSSDFLDPYEVSLCYYFLNANKYITYKVYGGFENAERKSIIINKDDTDDFMLLEISGKFKFNKSDHRKYLGSIMSLGISREKIGDLNVFENKAQLVCKKTIGKVILDNLDHIGREKVKVTEILEEDLMEQVLEYEESYISVSSMRLDNIVSSIINESRNKVAAMIEREYIKVNFKPILKKDYSLNEEDFISISKKGRYIVDSIIGTSKKGKKRILIKKIK